MIPLRAAPLALLLGCAPTPGEPAPSPTPTPPGAVQLACDRDWLDAAELVIAGDAVRVAQWELFAGDWTAQVEDALAAAAARTDVAVLLDDEIPDNAEARDRLLARGVPTRLHVDPEVRMHAKVLASTTHALVGSTNGSDSAIARNRECNVLVEGGPIPAALSAWIDDLDDPARGPVLDGGVDPALLVDDELLPSLLDLAADAEQRLDATLYATYLQPDNLDSPAMQWFGALADAAARGVTVRVVVDWSDWDEANTDRNRDAMQWLRDRGVDARWDRPDVTLHAKVAASESAAQIQTANPSTSGFAINREAGIRSSDDALLDDVATWFEARWFEARVDEW